LHREQTPLALREVVRVYLPLALSWIMMSAETPVSTAVINRLPNAQPNLAAFLAVLALSLFIESPVIDLLATSTTLATDSARFRSVRRFTVWLMAWVTAVHALVALTPLFDLVAYQLVNLPAEVAELARGPMAIMVPWSAAIGWRRFHQGLLIRSGQTRAIGVGTALRLLTISTVSVLGLQDGRLTGVEVAAAALVVSVVVEAVYVWRAAGGTVRRLLSMGPTGDALSTRALLAFHLPMAASTMVVLTSMPLVTRFLASGPDALLAMNGWQVSIALSFLMRTITLALPEVVIALSARPDSEPLLRRFCLTTGWALVAATVVFATFRVDVWWFSRVLGASGQVAEAAHIGFWACCLLPLGNAGSSYVRGRLTALHSTKPRLWAIGVNVALLVGSMVGLAAVGVHGVLMAAAALTVSLFAEWAVLAWFLRQRLAGRTA
jgi:progressive ankylosis protein